MAQKGRPELAKAIRADNEAIAGHAAISADWRAALDAYAVEHYPQIHRDYYRFPLLRQPEEVMDIARTREALADTSTLMVLGRVDWHIQPHTESIAGWGWQGWRMWYDIRLADGLTSNVVRQLGTWEIGGTAVGLTTAALRYRGLGRIEHHFDAGPDGGITQAFTTTEVIPGHVGTTPAISPIVPKSEAVGDRGYALRHRVGAWIVRMARATVLKAGKAIFTIRPSARNSPAPWNRPASSSATMALGSTASRISA
jgi:hypothetical protein